MIFNIYLHKFSDVFKPSNCDCKPSDRVNFSKMKLISEICDYFSKTLKTNKENIYVMNQGRLLNDKNLIEDLKDSENLHIFYKSDKIIPETNNYTTTFNTMTNIINSMINLYSIDSVSSTPSNNNNLEINYVTDEVFNNFPL